MTVIWMPAQKDILSITTEENILRPREDRGQHELPFTTAAEPAGGAGGVREGDARGMCPSDAPCSPLPNPPRPARSRATPGRPQAGVQ